MPQTPKGTPKGIHSLSHTRPETSGEVQRSQTVRGRAGKIEAMTPEALSQTLQEFLGGSRHAVVLEDGARIFELADSKYSVSGEYNKCLCICGRWTGILSGGFWTQKSAMVHCGSRYRDSGTPGRRSWKSAAVWTIARLRRAVWPDPPTSSSCGERWNAAFPDSPSRS